MPCIAGHDLNCSECGAYFVVCLFCLYHEYKYCSPSCRYQARLAKSRLYSLRYQQTKRGKLKHAARQAAYRAKNKVTQQYGTRTRNNLNKAAPSLTHCAFCGEEVVLQKQS